MSHKTGMSGHPPSALRPGKVRLRLLSAGILMLALPSTYFALEGFGQEAKPAALAEDLPAGSMQAKATTACAECHEARIIVQQRLNKATWTREIDKMIRWGAVVDPSDHDALIDYFSTNFGVDQSPYQPPRSSSGKKSGVQSR